MNLTEQLGQLAAMCFETDRPDYDPRRLKLYHDEGNSRILLIRLCIAVVLMLLTLFFKTHGFLWYVVLILAGIVAGADYLASAAICLTERNYFNGSVCVALAMVLAWISGNPLDAAAFIVLYRIVTLMIGYITDRTSDSMRSAVGSDLNASADLAAPDWVQYITPGGMILALVVLLLRLFVFHGGYSGSMRSAASVLVIANTASLVMARSLTWYCAIGGTYRCGIMVRSARAMRKLLQVRSIVLDDSSISDEDLPSVVSIKTTQLTPELLIKLAAHAESQSESRTARAILAAYPDEIDPSLIEKTLDIPDNGVESYVNGLRICVGTRELMILKGITIPDEDITDDYVVYISVADKYAGKLILKEGKSAGTDTAMYEFRKQGIDSLTVFSGANNDSIADIARDLKAEQLYAKLTEEEKVAKLADMQTALPRDASILYIQRGSVTHPKHSPADLDACMISPENNGQFDADLLILKDDLSLVPDTVDAARWAQNLCIEAFGIGAIVKVVLVILALFGVATMWFNIVLDGSALLATLLLSIRAYMFDQPHKLLQDYLPKK